MVSCLQSRHSTAWATLLVPFPFDVPFTIAAQMCDTKSCLSQHISCTVIVFVAHTKPIHCVQQVHSWVRKLDHRWMKVRCSKSATDKWQNGSDTGVPKTKIPWHIHCHKTDSQPDISPYSARFLLAIEAALVPKASCHLHLIYQGVCAIHQIILCVLFCWWHKRTSE
jgi:hypothetical protein